MVKSLFFMVKSPLLMVESPFFMVKSHFLMVKSPFSWLNRNVSWLNHHFSWLNQHFLWWNHHFSWLNHVKSQFFMVKSKKFDHDRLIRRGSWDALGGSAEAQHQWHSGPYRASRRWWICDHGGWNLHYIWYILCIYHIYIYITLYSYVCISTIYICIYVYMYIYIILYMWSRFWNNYDINPIYGNVYVSSVKVMGLKPFIFHGMNSWDPVWWRGLRLFMVMQCSKRADIHRPIGVSEDHKLSKSVKPCFFTSGVCWKRVVSSVLEV